MHYVSHLFLWLDHASPLKEGLHKTLWKSQMRIVTVRTRNDEDKKSLHPAVSFPKQKQKKQKKQSLIHIHTTKQHIQARFCPPPPPGGRGVKILKSGTVVSYLPLTSVSKNLYMKVCNNIHRLTGIHLCPTAYNVATWRRLVHNKKQIKTWGTISTLRHTSLTLSPPLLKRIKVQTSFSIITVASAK